MSRLLSDRLRLFIALVMPCLMWLSAEARAATVTIYPDTVTSTGSWTGATAANLTDSSDSTYAEATSATTFTTTMTNDAAYSGATINSVTVWARGFAIGSGGPERINIGPATCPGGNLGVSRTVFTDYSWAFTLTCASAAWTSSDVDNLSVDINTDVAGETMQVSEVWAVVDYTAGSAGALQFSASGYSVNEGGGTATITATRTGGSAGAVGVSYSTSDGSATAGSDYSTASGTLNWADGDAADKTFDVTITDDGDIESDETVTLTLSSPTGGATLGSPSTATLTITDNDGAPQVPAGGAVGSVLLIIGITAYALWRSKFQMKGA